MSSGVSARHGLGSSPGPDFKLLPGAKGQGKGQCCQRGQLSAAPQRVWGVGELPWRGFATQLGLSPGTECT